MKFSSLLSRHSLLGLVFIAALGLSACSEDSDPVAPPTTVGQRLYGVDINGNLVLFGAGNADVIVSSKSITGLQVGETIRGLDFRSTDGQLFGLGSSNRVYVIDTNTAAANALLNTFTPAFTGTEFGFDFNPVPENRIRVHSSAGENRRLNAADGATAATDPTLTFTAGDANTGTPALVATAYTNAFLSSTRPTTTEMFAIDASRDILVQVTPDLNAGVCTTIGPLGFNAASNISYDLVAKTGIGWATWVNDGSTEQRLYQINRTAGSTARATFVGSVGVRLVAMAGNIVP